MLHPATYQKHSSKKVAPSEYIAELRSDSAARFILKSICCVLVISITWILSVSLFATTVLPRTGYYFNSTGLMACDVFHSRIAFRILSCCAYYFPTTMALMYCYGSGFHISKTRNKFDPEARHNGVPPSCKNPHSDHDAVMQVPVRPHSVSTSRTMAAMSLGFIVMVTPATIQEVVAACTGCKIPPALDFIVTWLALSNSFWNPFLYWLLNSHFRRISNDLVQFYICCRRKKTYGGYDKPAGCCSSPDTSDGPPPMKEFEGLGEEYWGKILERTMSSNSLHAIQSACNRDMRCAGSFKGCPTNVCKHDHRYYNCPSDYRQFDRSAFQIETCPRQCRLKSSDFCLFRPNMELECGRSRSNLSLDEINFSKCNGRHPDL
ncbi:5-hydroxytryptamine receptor 5B [Eumeta japonica]|uniref:5-hydroxytryptamine receptor 5B n=1 Tax=Eumeta variegata TaxID=151549 RepID=A0A4C1WCE7_EUMVA|nr:5-hydroxytryptamine receptor 5B [Eumeta japonica]